MKRFAFLILPLMFLNFALAVVAIIVVIILKDQPQPWLIPLAVVFVINGIVFLHINSLNNRLNNLEIWFAQKSGKSKHVKEVKPPVFNSTYSVGQMVMLKNYLTIDDHTFRKNASGKIIKVVDREIYKVLFDEDSTKTYIVQESQLKEFSDL